LTNRSNETLYTTLNNTYLLLILTTGIRIQLGYIFNSMPSSWFLHVKQKGIMITHGEIAVERIENLDFNVHFEVSLKLMILHFAKLLKTYEDEFDHSHFSEMTSSIACWPGLRSVCAEKHLKIETVSSLDSQSFSVDIRDFTVTPQIYRGSKFVHTDSQSFVLNLDGMDDDEIMNLPMAPEVQSEAKNYHIIIPEFDLFDAHPQPQDAMDKFRFNEVITSGNRNINIYKRRNFWNERGS